MRKGQRFTPARLRRWHEQGRGSGTHGDYQPWHQITRDDPGSRGRSHLVNGHFGRLQHFLSDNELVAFGFATMLPALTDLREQFALPTEDGPDIDVGLPLTVAPWREGTLAIARSLGFKHPAVRQGDATELWVFTTDLVLSLRMPSGACELLAISVKDPTDLANDRKMQLLAIEREFWSRQGVSWCLLTSDHFNPSAGLAVKAAMCWSLGLPPAPHEQIDLCGSMSDRFDGHALPYALNEIRRWFGIGLTEAQAVFWQSVWHGVTPIDLALSVRPSSPLQIISSAAFWKQNPIASRRSAWSL